MDFSKRATRRSCAEAAKFLAETVWPLAAAIGLVFFLASQSKANGEGLPNLAAEPRKPFTVAFKPLPKGAAALEAAWQIENLIDIDQTLKISREPDRYQEVGTLALFSGPHPSAREVWVVSALFGVAHLAVSELLYVNDCPKALAGWQWISLGAKSANIGHNYSIGL
jgi:hypothetical protein